MHSPYPWLIHVNVWQKPLQYYKVISLQLIKINGKKWYKEKKRKKPTMHSYYPTVLCIRNAGTLWLGRSFWQSSQGQSNLPASMCSHLEVLWTNSLLMKVVAEFSSLQMWTEVLVSLQTINCGLFPDSRVHPYSLLCDAFTPLPKLIRLNCIVPMLRALWLSLFLTSLASTLIPIWLSSFLFQSGGPSKYIGPT